MSHRERKLTPAEQKRKAAFEVLCAQMARAGYFQKDFVIGILQANTLSFLIMLPFLALAAWIYSPFIAAGGSFFPGAQFFLLFLAIVGLLVVHECIHGLTWGLFAPRHFASISFGVIWKALTPYCTCSAPLRRWQYALGTAMPTLVLGGRPDHCGRRPASELAVPAGRDHDPGRRGRFSHPSPSVPLPPLFPRRPLPGPSLRMRLCCL